MLERMDKREATVLRMRFGLDEEEPKTLKQIGECLGLTRERVRQIESEALSKLRRRNGCRLSRLEKVGVSILSLSAPRRIPTFSSYSCGR